MHVSSFLSIMHVYHVRKYPSILNKHLFAKQSTCTTCYNAARWPIDVLKSTRSGQYSSRPQKQNSSTVRACAVVGPMPRWRGLKDLANNAYPPSQIVVGPMPRWRGLKAS